MSTMMISERIKTFIFPDMVLFDKLYYYLISMMDENKDETLDEVKKILQILNSVFIKMTKKPFLTKDITEEEFNRALLISSMFRDTFILDGIEPKKEKIPFKIPVFKYLATDMIFNESFFVKNNLNKNIWVVCKDEFEVDLLFKLDISNIEMVNTLGVLDFFEMTKIEKLKKNDIIEIVTADELMVGTLQEHFKDHYKAGIEVKISMPELPMTFNINKDILKKVQDCKIDLYYYTF